MIRVMIGLILRGILDLGNKPWAQALTLAAVTLVAFLGGLFLLFLHNLDSELMRQRGEVLFQVYWRPDTDMEVVASQWRQMDHLPYLKSKRTFTPDEALQALATSLPGGGDLEWLGQDNPLPPTALVAFSPEAPHLGTWTKETRGYLENLPGVERVHHNTLRTDLAAAWSGFSRNVIWPLICFLGLVCALIVANTIKLSLVERKTEIEILHLVGAKDWYVRLPHVVNGAVQGGVGGALALCMLKLVQLGLKDILNFPPLFLSIDFLPTTQALAMIAALTLVGTLSSWLAVRKLAA